jgi:hypothetical protein
MAKTLKNLRQSVEAFAGAAAAAVIEPMSQKLAQTSFLASVKSDVGLILKARSPLTLEEATQIASEDEQMQKSKANSYSSSRYEPPQNRPNQPNFPNSSPPRPTYNQPNLDHKPFQIQRTIQPRATDIVTNIARRLFLDIILNIILKKIRICSVLVHFYAIM